MICGVPDDRARGSKLAEIESRKRQGLEDGYCRGESGEGKENQGRGRICIPKDAGSA